MWQNSRWLLQAHLGLKRKGVLFFRPELRENPTPAWQLCLPILIWRWIRLCSGRGKGGREGGMDGREEGIRERDGKKGKFTGWPQIIAITCQFTDGQSRSTRWLPQAHTLHLSVVKLNGSQVKSLNYVWREGGVHLKGERWTVSPLAVMRSPIHPNLKARVGGKSVLQMPV